MDLETRTTLSSTGTCVLVVMHSTQLCVYVCVVCVHMCMCVWGVHAYMPVNVHVYMCSSVPLIYDLLL